MVLRRSPKTYEHILRRTITRLVGNEFPGCHPEFFFDGVGIAPRKGRLGFQIIDQKGKVRSEVIWLNPAFFHRPNKQWLLRETRRRRAFL
jgi:hypothetical protein